jgi:hypothetical protein
MKMTLSRALRRRPSAGPRGRAAQRLSDAFYLRDLRSSPFLRVKKLFSAQTAARGLTLAGSGLGVGLTGATRLAERCRALTIGGSKPCLLLGRLMLDEA